MKCQLGTLDYSRAESLASAGDGSTPTETMDGERNPTAPILDLIESKRINLESSNTAMKGWGEI
jgi:hypothetical protein